MLMQAKSLLLCGALLPMAVAAAPATTLPASGAALGTPRRAPAADTPKARRAFTHDLHDALVTLSGAEPADTFSPIGGDA